MKKIVKKATGYIAMRMRRRRYRRLYLRLFMMYAEKNQFSEPAGEEAANAFFWLTGKYWADQL